MMTEKESRTREKKVDALLAEADHWLTVAETAPDQEKALTSCRKAVRDLLFAFLWAKGGNEPVDPGPNLLNLWEECVRLDPELFPLVACLRFFQEGEGSSSPEDRDLLLEAANEVWDFIYGSLTE